VYIRQKINVAFKTVIYMYKTINYRYLKTKTSINYLDLRRMEWAIQTLHNEELRGFPGHAIWLRLGNADGCKGIGMSGVGNKECIQNSGGVNFLGIHMDSLRGDRTILWHADPLLGNDSEINNWTTVVTRQQSVNRSKEKFFFVRFVPRCYKQES
jgi:hypothetical protein